MNVFCFYGMISERTGSQILWSRPTCLPRADVANEEKEEGDAGRRQILGLSNLQGGTIAAPLGDFPSRSVSVKSRELGRPDVSGPEAYVTQ